MKPSYLAYDSTYEALHSPEYSFSVQVAENDVRFSRNRRYNGLRQENGLWIKWIPSPALAKRKSSPMDTL